MAPAFNNDQSRQDETTAREPLVDINTEPTQSVDPNAQTKPGRKKLSDVQDSTDEPQPEAKPQRRRLSVMERADQEEPEPVPEPQPSSGRPRLSIAQSQTAVLEAPDDAEPSHAGRHAPARTASVRTASKPLDPAKIERWIADLRARQNFPLAAVAGLLAAIVGALIWAVVTVLTNYQIGWMAVGVGFLVGGVVRLFGRGLEKRFGYLGAGMALFGCLLGNCLAYCMLIARDAGLSFTAVLTQVDPAALPNLMIANVHPLDIVFYGLALYEGYRFSFLRITQAQLSRVASE